MKKKKLYCDIDSTINNHWVRIQRWALPTFPGTSIDQRAFTKEEIMKDSPLPDSLDAIKKLSKFYEIHFLTARNFFNAYDITKEWLEFHKFPYDTINVVRSSREKPGFLLKSSCDLFIDDLSAGQEFGPSYKNLYTETIRDLNLFKIPYEVFSDSNNWSKILSKYLPRQENKHEVIK